MSWYHNTSETKAAQALDRPMQITRFPEERALSKRTMQMSTRELAAWIEEQSAPTKAELPWLKQATFGPKKSKYGCYRTNNNMKAIEGIEGDYDGEIVTLAEAEARVKKAGFAALFYPTARHTPEKPRWRVFCPLSNAMSPDARSVLLARLNGALGGILAPESFNKSLAYYAGSVDGKPPVKTVLVEGEFIDKVKGLKPIYKDGSRNKPQSKTSNGQKSGLPFAEVAEALMAIPNDGSNPDDDGRDWWLHIGMALHHETDDEEEGREAFHDWSARHPSYDGGKTDAAWDSFGGEGRTAATILREARKHGWHNAAAHERKLAEDLELLDDCWTPEELAAASAQAALEELDRIVYGDDKPKSRLTFLSPSDCENLPTRRYVIKGLLAEGDVGTIVGAPGAGKSLLAPYLGFMVAQGEPAFGRRTRQGGVFYVAAEDGLGMRGRVRALRDEYGDADGFKLVAGVSDLLAKNSPDLKELLKAVKRDRPSLIIVDTIAVAFPGLEENDAKSMGQVVHVARQLARRGAAVLLIHHDTKDGSNGLPRGHSILNGAVDVNLYLKREDGAVTGKLTKNRNGSTDEKLAFTVATIPLGEDEDGDTITTAICREADSADTGSREVKLSPSAKAALTVFYEIGDGAPVGESIWRDRAIEGRRVSAADDRDGRRRTFKRAVEELTRKNVLVFRDGKFATGDSPEALLGDDDV